MREQAEDEWPPTNVRFVERLQELPPEFAVGRRPIEELDRDEKYLTKNYALFESLYPGEWIAVFEQRLVAHSRRATTLWRELRKAGIAEKSPATFFIERPENL